MWWLAWGLALGAGCWAGCCRKRRKEAKAAEARVLTGPRRANCPEAGATDAAAAPAAPEQPASPARPPKRRKKAEKASSTAGRYPGYFVLPKGVKYCVPKNMPKPEPYDTSSSCTGETTTNYQCFSPYGTK